LTLAVASGKGGTGKTTVAVALALSLAGTRSVQLLDCDVEEPNTHLFLRQHRRTVRTINTLVPRVDPEVCTGCGQCASHCAFNALAVTGGKLMIFPELCHSCGRCLRHCPVSALTETPVPIGTLTQAEDGPLCYWGTLDLGQPMAPPLIREVRKEASVEELTVIDSPPGTSCSMIAAVRGSDYVFLVTEPTPFGLNDLGLALETVKGLGIPHGVILNRSGRADALVEEYCARAGVGILMKIPESRRVAEALARGKTLLDPMPEIAHRFVELMESL